MLAFPLNSGKSHRKPPWPQMTWQNRLKIIIIIKSTEPQLQYIKRLSNWLLATKPEALHRHIYWFYRLGVIFTEVLITCGDKTACDTQLSCSHRRLVKKKKKRSVDLHMGEVVEHNGEEVGGGAMRRSYQTRSSNRSPVGDALIGSRLLRRNYHSLFLHVGWREKKASGGVCFFF